MTSQTRSSSPPRSVSSRSTTAQPSRSGAAVSGRTSFDPAAVSRSAPNTDSQNRCGSRSSPCTGTHAARSARPAARDPGPQQKRLPAARRCRHLGHPPRRAEPLEKPGPRDHSVPAAGPTAPLLDRLRPLDYVPRRITRRCDAGSPRPGVRLAAIRSSRSEPEPPMSTTITVPTSDRCPGRARRPRVRPRIPGSDWDDSFGEAPAAEPSRRADPPPGRVLAAGPRVRGDHARHHPAHPAVCHLPGPVAFLRGHGDGDLRRLRRRGPGHLAAGRAILGPGRAQAGAGRGARRSAR